MEKVIVLGLKVDGFDRVIKDGKELNEVTKATNQVFQTQDFGSKGRKEWLKQLGQLKAAQKANRDAIRRSQRAAELAAIKGTGSYREMELQLITLRDQFRQLSKEEAEGAVGEETIRRIQELDQALRQQDERMGQYFRNVGNYRSALNGLGIDIVKFTSVAGLVEFGAEKLLETIPLVQEMIEEYRNLNKQISDFSGASGDELLLFSSTSRALANQFGEDAEKINIAANSVAKAFNIEFGDAFNFIEQGFLNGSNNTGEFLDILREYPIFFAESGASADRFFEIISKQVTGGVFSDKGVDAIKEAEIALREMPQATEDALAAIGISSQEIREAIGRDGIMSAIDLVIDRLGDFEDDSEQVGQVLADVFKSAGEDAGIEFIKSLDKTEGGIDSLIDKEDELVKSQIRLLEANKSVEFANAQLASTFEPVSEAATIFQSELQVLALEGLKLALDFIIKFLAILKEIPSFIQENKEGITLLGLGLVTLNANLIATNAALLVSNIRTKAKIALDKGAILATQLWSVAQKGLNAAMKANPIGLVITAVGLVITGLQAAYNSSLTFRAAINGLGSVAKEVFTVIKEAVAAFVNGFSELKEGNFKAAFKAFSEGLTKANPIGIAFTQGGRLAKAFSDGYSETIANAAADSAGKDLIAESEKLNEELKNTKDSASSAVSGLDDFTKKAREAEVTLKKLRNERDKLQEQLEDTPTGARFNKLAARIKQINTQIDKLEGQTQVARKRREKEVVEHAEGSIDALKEVVSKIEKELTATSNANDPVLVQKLINAKKELEAAEEIKNQLIDRLSNPLTVPELLTPVKINVEIGLESFEATEQRINIAREKAIQEARANASSYEEFVKRRQQIELEAERKLTQAKIDEILRAQAERQKTGQLTVQEIKDNELEILELRREQADKELEIEREKQDAISELEEQRIEKLKQNIGTVTGILSSVTSLISDISSEATQNQLFDLEQRYDREIELAEGNAQRQAELQEEYEAQRRDIQRRAFEREKKIKISEILIEGAKNVVEAAPNVALQVIQGIITAAQVAFVSSQKFRGEKGLKMLVPNGGRPQGVPMKNGFKLMNVGGNVTIGKKAVGPSHAQGGIKTIMHGQPVEIEGGEHVDVDEYGNIIVINKRSSRTFSPLLDYIGGRVFDGKSAMMSDINSYRNFGVKFAQQGAVIPSNIPIAQQGQVLVVKSFIDPASMEQLSNETANAVGNAAFDAILNGAVEGKKADQRNRQLEETLGEI